MSAEFLTDEWFATVAAAGAELPERPGLDVVVDVEVAGAPGGKVRYHEVWRDGRLVAVASGKGDGATVTMVLKHPDAVALVRNEVSPDVAFMQGRFKIDGDYAAWLFGFRPVTGSDEYRRFRAAVAEATTVAG